MLIRSGPANVFFINLSIPLFFTQYSVCFFFSCFFCLDRQMIGSGHLDVVRWLVKTAGADPNKVNTDGCTPLFFACEKGHLGVAQWLVRDAGAQVRRKY